jgi:hypothetical protein
MNTVYITILKILRKIYIKTFRIKINVPYCENDPEIASRIIYNELSDDKPIMISRFGSNELNVLINYLSVKSRKKSVFNYINGTQFDWWWNKGVIKNFKEVAGFFPIDEESLGRFAELMISDMKEVDVLGTWRPEENNFKNEISGAKKITLELLNPYFSELPWTKALEGKKVLVVHPFAYTIERQYLKRELLFKNNILPQFELKTIRAVQSLAGNDTGFSDWFEALEYMKSEIDKQDYDMCLIGAGAYGFPLAAHVKRMGKKAIHLGGSLQLLFGIIGARWENPNYNPIYNYAALINDHWVRPNLKERPRNIDLVEGGCYW